MLQVEEVNGEPWQGRVYLYYEGGALLKGDLLRAEGQVLSAQSYGNFAAFDYNLYLQRQGIAASVSCYFGGTVTAAGWAEELATVRGRLVTAIDEAAGDQAALIKGILLGDKSDLTYAERNEMSLVGAAHILAVSGLHVGYLVGFALMVVGAGRKRRWWRLGVVVALLLFYTGLTGWPASVLRASLMTLCLLLAQALDECNDRVTALALAMLLCLLYQPLWLFDAGFQLSFAAAFGIIYLLPLFEHLLGIEGRRKRLRGIFALTLAASLATMPLVSYYFFHISLIGWLLAPLFVLGAGAIVLFGLVAAVLAVHSVWLATLPLYGCALIALILNRCAAWSARLPFAYLASGRTPLYAVLLFYAGLLLLPPFWRRVKRQRLFTLCAMLLLILLLCFAPGGLADGLLEVVFLDVGQGDAALAITPAGRTILIDDGGRPLSPGTIGEQVLLPYLEARGVRQIDLMISSHPDLDHLGGLLTVLAYLPVRQLIYADAFPGHANQERLLVAAQENGAALTPVSAGQIFELEPDLYLSIYNPAAGSDYSGDPNDGSVVCLLSYGQIDFLFTGDSAFAAWPEIPAAEVVKLPHHGSANNGAYDEAAYAQLQAEAVVLSVGANNGYGHPHATVIEYWQDHAEVYRTDWQGAITFYTDGHSWWAITYLTE